MNKDNLIWQNLQRFANEHKLILQEKGEVGFGRSCVGFLHGNNYIDYNPMNLHDDVKMAKGDYYIFDDSKNSDSRLHAPAGIESYHKHDCLAVLVENDNYDEGLIQLNKWIEYLEAQGGLEIVQFETGATGLQALMSGLFGHAIKFKEN